MVSTILNIENIAMNKNSVCLPEVFILEGDTDKKKQTKNEVSVMSRNGKFHEEKLSRVMIERFIGILLNKVVKKS